MRRANGEPAPAEKGSFRKPAAEAMTRDWDVAHCRKLVHAHKALAPIPSATQTNISKHSGQSDLRR